MRTPRSALALYGAIFVFAASSAVVVPVLVAQDISISQLMWEDPTRAPDELPIIATAPDLRIPDGLRDADGPAYAVFSIVLSEKGETLVATPHFSSTAFRTAIPWDKFSFKPAKRTGKTVPCAVMLTVIFNPKSADPMGPSGTPRLLEVSTVRGEWRTKEDRILVATVEIDETGRVTGAEASDAPQAVQKNLVRAARNWRFAPARRNGVPVPDRIQLPVVVTTPMPILNGERTQPKATLRTQPVYPMAMRAAGMRGEVVVDFVVDIEGRPRSAFVLRSLNPAFEDAALDAVMSWRFEPGRVGRVPVNTHMQVPIVFSLTETYGGGEGPLNEPRRRTDLSKLPPEFRYDKPPVIRGCRRVVYPYEALKADKTGYAIVSYTLGKSGKVMQAAVTEATVPEFGEALAAAIGGFTYEPAQKDGMPCLAMLAFRQEFNREPETAIVSDDDLEMLRREKRKPQSIVRLQDLDGAPKPLSQKPVLFPVNVPLSITTGTATIEFIIDEEGRARIPRIVAASMPAFGHSAVQAVAAWRFEPPTRGGRPVAVRAQIPVNFESPALKPAARTVP